MIRGNEDTAFHHAISEKKHEVLVSLLQSEADPSVANEKGVTPLHLAIQRGDLVAIKALVGSGRDVGLDGQTIKLARLLHPENLEIINILKENRDKRVAIQQNWLAAKVLLANCMNK